MKDKENKDAKSLFNKAMKKNKMFEKDVLKRAVNHKLRQSIIALFIENEDIASMTLKDVSQKLGIEMSVASKHLDIVRRSGIIKADKQELGVLTHLINRGWSRL